MNRVRVRVSARDRLKFKDRRCLYQSMCIYIDTVNSGLVFFCTCFFTPQNGNNFTICGYIPAPCIRIQFQRPCLPYTAFISFPMWCVLDTVLHAFLDSPSYLSFTTTRSSS